MSPKVAVFVTFLVSGLMHDYMWEVVFYNNNGDDDYDGPQFGKVTAFFTYVALVMILERPLGQLHIFQWMKFNLPINVRSTLLVVLHLPVAHWYVCKNSTESVGVCVLAFLS